MAESDDDLTVVDETDFPMHPSIPSCLGRLHAPTKSEMARRRHVAFNPPHDGKRYKHPKRVSDPKSISPTVHEKSYRNRCFVVPASRLFCTACREEPSVKARVLKLQVKCAKHNGR